jgi:hypothetical protein
MGSLYINYLGTTSLKRYFIDVSIGVNIYVTFCVNLSSLIKSIYKWMLQSQLYTCEQGTKGIKPWNSLASFLLAIFMHLLFTCNWGQFVSLAL